MKETEFNLIDEPWIKVMEPNGEVKEVSLLSALLDSDKYIDLAGETETQNVAVLRLLLAIMHAVFYRVNENGDEEPLEEDDIDIALERWKALWDMKAMPKKPVTDYLEKWRDRFWLFHPERPFYQSLSAKEGTYYPIGKFVGEVSESKNPETDRIFRSRLLKEGDGISYNEAARWLLYINGFDDAAVIKKGSRKRAPLSWLGELGIVYAKGENLYETLLLNFVVLNNDNSLWSDEPPTWEVDGVFEYKPEKLPEAPDSQMALLTLQSRRILLENKDGEVVRYQILDGDFFDKKYAASENMTEWKTKEKKRGNPEFEPCPHTPGRQMWRDFSGLFIPTNKRKIPGVVEWVSRLHKDRYISLKLISFASAGNRYDVSIKSAVTDILGDGLIFHMGLMNDIDNKWLIRVNDEVEKCDKAAEEIRSLASKVFLASGGAENQNKKTGGKGSGPKEKYCEKFEQQWYGRIDLPFRRWLMSLDPATGEKPYEAAERWHKTAKKIALNLAYEMIDNEPVSVVFGISKKKKDNKYEEIYSAAKAHIDFKNNISGIYGRSEN